MVQEGTSMAAQIRYMAANNNHVLRADALRDLVDFACAELETYRHLKKKHSEDQLTIEIVSNLKMLGLEADHDPQHGGHCDIVVKAPYRFVWMAEAKKHSSYDWLDDGFQQLTTRYSTGTIGQDQGEVLIYCWNADAKAMLDNWRSKLGEKNQDIEVFDDPGGNPLAFWSRHKHVNSGLDFTTRHKVVALYHDPAK